MDQRQQTPDRHTWSVDVAALSVDGWQPNEDAVVMRSQRRVAHAWHRALESSMTQTDASDFYT